jgi:DNA-binding response OmpR family regulator
MTRHKVLIVEDEPDVATTYEMWLDDEYDVYHAPDGPTGLEMLDDSFRVVLLDRMMPGMSGREVLERIRDSGYDCHVAMVTAVDADFDILEMGFDDYVSKPPSREQLRNVVAQLVERADTAETLQQYHALLAKRSALRTEKTAEVLESSDDYASLEAQIERARADIEASADVFLDDATFLTALRNANKGGPRE